MSDEQIPAEAEAPAEENDVKLAEVDAGDSPAEPEAEPAEEAPASQVDDVSAASTDPILKPISEEGEATKEIPHPYEPAQVLAGEKRISRVLLDEINERRAVADIELLLAACRGMLDELEGKE